MNEAFTTINTELEHGRDRPVAGPRLQFEQAGLRLTIRTQGEVGAMGQVLYSELEDILRGFGLRLNQEGTILTLCIYYWDWQDPPLVGGVDLQRS